MENNKKYLHIKSMSQLKIERAMLDSNIVAQERMFDIQYSRFRERIQIGNLLSSLVSKIAVVLPLVVKTANTVKSFYNFILDQFKSKNKEESDTPEEYNSQYENNSLEDDK